MKPKEPPPFLSLPLQMKLRRVEDQTGRICEVVTVVKRRPMRPKRPRAKRT